MPPALLWSPVPLMLPLVSLAEVSKVVQGGALNMRAEPSLSAQVLRQYPTGTWMTVLEDMGEWSKVRVNGLEGYVMSKYLSDTSSDSTLYVRTNTGRGLNLRDLPSLYGIKDIQELNKLFVHIAFLSGNEFSYESLSQGAGIKKETIKKYLEYLEAAFLIKVVNRIDQNARRMLRVTSFKIYLTNPSLRCALFTPITDNDENIGNMVETAIFSQWIQGGKSDFYYANWAKGREKGEVDLVWTNPATQKAFSLVEIKWTDRFADAPTELKSLYHFLDNNPGIREIIVTSKTISKVYDSPKGQILFIPAALYAYWIST